MSRNKPPRPRPVVPMEPETPLDFDPAERLRNVVNARPAEAGITIDPRGTRIIDDGLWIRSLGTGWLIKTSIADVPSMIPEASIIEQVARARGEEKELGRRKLQRMFPETFLDRYVSLHEGKARPAITFRIELDKSFSIKNYRIFRSAFTSGKQCDFQPLRAQLDITRAEAGAWKEVTRGLSRARQKKLADEGDFKINGDKPTARVFYPGAGSDESLAETLIHEVMLLTNTVAGEFFKAHNQSVPTKVRGIYMEETSVTPDFHFDQVCNKLCWKVANYLDNQKSGYSRLTSPMRNFRDYITIKVMGKILADQNVDSTLRRDVIDFTEVFNQTARRSESLTLSPGWRNNWGRLLAEQKHHHPFDRALGYPGTTSAGSMDELCRKNKWQRPIVAERTLIFQGTHLYFAGMNFHPPQGRDIQTWAVAPDPDIALEMASHRMLQTIAPMAALMPAPKATP